MKRSTILCEKQKKGTDEGKRERAVRDAASRERV
jgi:hypothetical protein